MRLIIFVHMYVHAKQAAHMKEKCIYQIAFMYHYKKNETDGRFRNGEGQFSF